MEAGNNSTPQVKATSSRTSIKFQATSPGVPVSTTNHRENITKLLPDKMNTSLTSTKTTTSTIRIPTQTQVSDRIMTTITITTTTDPIPDPLIPRNRATTPTLTMDRMLFLICITIDKYKDN